MGQGGRQGCSRGQAGRLGGPRGRSGVSQGVKGDVHKMPGGQGVCLGYPIGARLTFWGSRGSTDTVDGSSIDL